MNQFKWKIWLQNLRSRIFCDDLRFHIIIWYNF